MALLVLIKGLNGSKIEGGHNGFSWLEGGFFKDVIVGGEVMTSERGGSDSIAIKGAGNVVVGDGRQVVVGEMRR